MSTSGIVERSEQVAAAVERKSKDWAWAKLNINTIHPPTGESDCNEKKGLGKGLNNWSESVEGFEWRRYGD